MRRPELITELSEEFGAQAVVLAIDARSAADGGWNVYTRGGRDDEGIDAVEWAARGEELGAGEILLTSMDTDGVQTGFDCASHARGLATPRTFPVIASGGAGKPEDFSRVLSEGEADAALAASIFHYGTYTVGDLKQYPGRRRNPGTESADDHSLHRSDGRQGRAARPGARQSARRRRPLEMLRRFAAFPEIQVIDLDAAHGHGREHRRWSSSWPPRARSRVGGGVRDAERARKL